jgi:hypothetical protein
LTPSQRTDECFLNQILGIVDRAEHSVAMELNLPPINFRVILKRLFVHFRPIRTFWQNLIAHEIIRLFCIRTCIHIANLPRSLFRLDQPAPYYTWNTTNEQARLRLSESTGMVMLADPSSRRHYFHY